MKDENTSRILLKETGKYKIKPKLVVLLLILFGFQLHGQNTFSRVVDLDRNADRNFLDDMEIVDSTIFTTSSSYCDYGSVKEPCVSLSKFNGYGKIEKTLPLNSFTNKNSGTENLILNDGNIIISSHLRSDDFNSSSVLNFDFDLNGINTITYNQLSSEFELDNQGVNMVDSSLYLFGVSRKSDISSSGQIIKTDLEGNEIWRENYGSADSIVNINSLQSTPDGSLAFILELSSSASNNIDGYYIMKIDPDGMILDSFLIEETDKQPNRLLVGSDGGYYCGVRNNPLNPDDVNFGSSGAILRINSTLDSIEWVFRMPSDPLINGRIYEMHDFIEAQNGDIIISGAVFDEEEIDTIDIYQVPKSHGFIIRLSPSGEMKWLHLYKNINNLVSQDGSGLFRPSNLNKIRELPDGRIAGAGNVYVDDLQFAYALGDDIEEDYHLWLMMVDENGCLEYEECNEVILIDDRYREPKEYHSIVKSGQTWVNRIAYWSTFGSYQYHYDQDSVLFGDKYYHKRIQSDHYDASDEKIEGYYNERDGKLYKYVDDGEDHVVLDMNLSVGDSFLIETNRYNITMVVVYEDVVTFSDNIPRKRLELGCSDFIDSYFWIEGIGEMSTGDYCIYDGLDGYVGCVSDSLGNQIFMNDRIDECWDTTSTLELDDERCKVYPNPFNTTLNIEVSGYDEIDIVVYDFLGKMVYSNSTDQSNHSINTNNWDTGMYIINVRSEGKVIFTDKVVLIH